MDRILINGFYIPFLPKLNYFKDGEGVNTVLFIIEPDGQFMISFEEGMECIDLMIQSSRSGEYVLLEYEQEDKYLHICRRDIRNTGIKEPLKKIHSMSYFHINVQDWNGNLRACPGQVSVAPGYEWNDGVEPVLLALMEGITVADRLSE